MNLLQSFTKILLAEHTAETILAALKSMQAAPANIEQEFNNFINAMLEKSLLLKQKITMVL